MNATIEEMCEEHWSNTELYLPAIEPLHDKQEDEFYDYIDESDLKKAIFRGES